MEKIRRWNAKSFVIELDDEDVNADMCIMSDGGEICSIPTKEVKKVGEKYHHIIKLEGELSKVLWDDDEDKKYDYELRIEDEPFEEGELLIIKKSLDDKNTETESEDTED